MEKPSQIPINQYIREILLQYFSDHGDEWPVNLYNNLLGEIEKPLLKVVMEKTHDNQSLAAQILGINRNTLRKKLKQYQLI